MAAGALVGSSFTPGATKFTVAFSRTKPTTSATADDSLDLNKSNLAMECYKMKAQLSKNDKLTTIQSLDLGTSASLVRSGSRKLRDSKKGISSSFEPSTEKMYTDFRMTWSLSVSVSSCLMFLLLHHELTQVNSSYTSMNFSHNFSMFFFNMRKSET